MANYELSWDYVEASERIVVNITKQHLLINSEFQFFGKVFKCYGNSTTPIAENEIPLSECTFSGYDTSVLTGRNLSDPQTVTVSWVNELGQTLSTTYELYILNNSRTKVLASDTNGLATIRIEGKGQSAFDLYVNGVKSNYTFASIVSADKCNDLTSSSTTKEKQDWFAKWIGYDISRNIELLTTNFTATNANPIINNTVDSSATRFAHYQTLDTTKIQSAPADDFVP